jgi:serine/threonine protein kinase
LLFCFHLAYSFEILRSINYIHADINPQNFFINLSNGELAVIDFDSGAITDNPKDKPDTFGKIAEADWLAPEILEQLANQTTQIPTIKVNLHTDTWSVAVGIHYLIFLQHPFFFLKDLGTETVTNYLKNNQWYEINAIDPNFNTNLDYAFYTKYKTLLENNVPKAITERWKSTFTKGYSNPVLRATYDQWTIDLKVSQQPPIIDKFKVNKKAIIEGQEIDFFWTIRNVNRVTLNGKDVTNQNTLKIQPLKSGIYVLEATNLFGSVLSEKIEVDVIPMPKIELSFPTPNFSISFNRQSIQTKLPNINVMFPLDTNKLSKFDESLLTQTNGFEVEHTLRKRILKALSKVFLIISIITISLVMGFYFGTIS